MEEGGPEVTTATIRQCDFEEAAPLLARAFGPRTDTTGGLLTMAEACQGAECFMVEGEGGKIMAAYAVSVSQHSGGRVAWVCAAGSVARGPDLTASILPVIEQQAAGAEQVAITTRRRGLVKKLVRQGYEITGITLRKRIQ